MKSVFKTKTLIKHILEKYRKDLNHKEIQFLLSKVDSFEIPNFYIIPKIHKDPKGWQAYCRGYNWITAPISEFMAHFLKESYKHFDTILKEGFTLFWM